jgi:hypothetical protein
MAITQVLKSFTLKFQESNYAYGGIREEEQKRKSTKNSKI